MWDIASLIVVSIFTYCVCLLEHNRVINKLVRESHSQMRIEKGNAYKEGYVKASAELMPCLHVDNLKMTRETLCVAQVSIREFLTYGPSKQHIERLGELIACIDKLRPLGNDGKHGDRHTEWCGCKDVKNGSTTSLSDW